MDRALGIANVAAGCPQMSRKSAPLKLFPRFARGRPNVAVMSARLEDDPSRGILILRKLVALHSGSDIIMLLPDDERELAVQTLRPSARGIFCRTGIATVKSLSEPTDIGE